MWTIFKSVLNLSQYCFCSLFWLFVRKACGVLAHQLEMEPVHSKAEF